MKKESKKYLIKESELREIIQEMLIMELYNPDDYKGLYTPGHKGSTPMPKDYIKGIDNLFKGAMSSLIPDSWKEKVAEGDRRVLQYILGLVGAQKAGTARPDFIPSLSQLLTGNGQNADAHEQFNVKEAVKWLLRHAYPYYIKEKCGNCARNVGIALNIGGLQVPYAMNAGSAKNYYNILKANGWDEIPVSQAGELGDVVVITPYKDIKGNALHTDGHIAMCCGNGLWVSDFKQNTMHGITGTPPPPGAIHVFRYKNRI